jgi:hypothetical protein
MKLTVARILLLVCALFAVIPATAGAATTPKVTSVSPLKLKIGERLTVRGKGFLRGKNRNTVVFKASGARAVFVKAESATATKLVVKVPAKLAPFLQVSAGQPKATRFQLRVLAKKLSPSYTSKGHSPVIAPATAATTTTAKPGAAKTPAAAGAAAGASAAAPAAAVAPPSDCDRDGTPDASDADDDNDLISDTDEVAIGTSPCNADTDADGMQDGWEYQSAKDFNRESCPAAAYPTPCAGLKLYPVKRPYTNPLYPDSNEDYDGDYLPAGLEYRMWKAHTPNTLNNMWYSDGMQASRDSDDSDGCVGLREYGPNGHVDEYPENQLAFPTVRTSTNGAERWSRLYSKAAYTLDADGSGCLTDDERDEDGDFLSNEVEANTMMTGPDYIASAFSEPLFKTKFAGTDPLDADSDGDTIVDGMDDQDQDDFWNVEEIVRGSKSSTEVQTADGIDAGTDPDLLGSDTEKRSGLWVDPFNPCLPAIKARSCPRALLLGTPAWRPFTDSGDVAPNTRWPLYRDNLYFGDVDGAAYDELWTGVTPAEQILPLHQPGDTNPGPQHPLLPRPSTS